MRGEGHGHLELLATLSSEMACLWDNLWNFPKRKLDPVGFSPFLIREILDPGPQSLPKFLFSGGQ